MDSPLGQDGEQGDGEDGQHGAHRNSFGGQGGVALVLHGKKHRVGRHRASRLDHAGDQQFRLGADEVIQPEQDVAERLARRLTMDNISDLFEFKGSAIAEVTVPESLSGHSLRQLDLRNRFNVTVLLLRKPGGSSETVMTPDTILEKGDQLTVFGSQKSIIELFREK